MKVISFLIKKMTSTQVPLGRWRVEGAIQTFLKIDMSNEDHCGTCGQYASKLNKKAHTPLNIRKPLKPT
jgi:hypothetical protein